MEIYSMAIFNFIITFISLFYVLDINPSFKRLMSCFLLNLFIATAAAEFQEMQWLPILLCVFLGGSLFYVFTRNWFVFLHIINIHLITIVIESFILFVAASIPIPLTLHGVIILGLLFGSLSLYKKWVPSLFLQIDEMAKFKWSRYLFLIAVVSFFIFYLQMPVPAANGELQVTMLNLVILIVYSLFLLLSFKLIASIWKKEIELKQKEAERYYFEMYSTELEKTNKRMRTLQHDYANILLSLNGYIQNQDMKGLAAYFNKFVLKTGHHEPGVFPSLKNMNIPEIKGLLAVKLLRAGDLSVSAQVEIPEKIDYISIDKIDLSRILGILLDNAIEASAVQESSQIQVAFLNTHHNGVLIVINNTLKQPFPDMSRLFEESYSTKEDSRGSGLYNVKQILSKYPAITLNTYLENEWFIQELLIERKESK